MDFSKAYANEPRRAVFCMDAKSFYASVECIERGLDPLKTLLVVMSGDENKAGLVLAASPRAKRVLGISNVSRAFNIPLHPELLIVPPRMNLYIKYQMRILEIFRRYMADEDIHVFSIDEMFGDLEASWKLFGDSPEDVVRMIQEDVYEELGVYVTIGLAVNPLLAKVAMDTDAKKNDDLFASWDYADVPDKLWPLQLTDLCGINKGMEARFKTMGCDCIGDIAHLDPYQLKRTQGVMGLQYYMHAWGVDRSMIRKQGEYKPASRSIGNSQVLMRDYKTRAEILTVLFEICEQVCQRLRKVGQVGSTLHISIGYSAGARGGFSRQMKIPKTNQARALCEAAQVLFDKYWDKSIVRHVGVTVGSLQPAGDLQLNLFEEPEKTIRDDDLDDVIAKIRAKYDFSAIIRARSKTSGGTALERAGLVGGHAGGRDGLI